MGVLEIEVLSVPTWDDGGLTSDLHRMKSGLLYGDTVTISSLPLATVYYAARIARGGLSDREVLEEILQSTRTLAEDALDDGAKPEAIASLEAVLQQLDSAERTGDAGVLQSIRAVTDEMRSYPNARGR